MQQSEEREQKVRVLKQEVNLIECSKWLQIIDAWYNLKVKKSKKDSRTVLELHE